MGADDARGAHGAVGRNCAAQRAQQGGAAMSEPLLTVVPPHQPEEEAPSTLDLGWLERQLEHLAELDRAIAGNEAVLADAVRRLKARHEALQAPLQAEATRRREWLEGYCRVHRDALLVGKRKS